MSDEVITKREILGLIAKVAALTISSYITMKWLMEALDPTSKQQAQAQDKAKKLINTKTTTKNISSADSKQEDFSRNRNFMQYV